MSDLPQTSMPIPPFAGAQLAAVILAGGEGRRIGGDKPLKPLGGLSLIERAVRQARQWSDTVAIAARTPGQVAGAGVPVLTDRPDIGGPLAGLRSGFETGAGLVLTVPCDMPFLPPDLPIRLRAALGRRGAALAASAGRVHPVCGLWQGDNQSALEDYLARGLRSMIGFAEEVGYVAVECEEDALVNINTPADLARAELRLA